MRERINALRDKTGQAVCLVHHQWAYTIPNRYEERFEVWVALHSTHYYGDTAEEAMEKAERACA